MRSGIERRAGPVKFSGEKSAVELIPPESIIETGEAFLAGKKKYGEDNWAIPPGIAWRVLIGAIIRHTCAFAKGENVDPENGQSHLAAIAFSAMVLMEYVRYFPEGDDRPTRWREAQRDEGS